MINISIVTGKKVSLKQDQRGLASILITLVIMVVIGLIVLGFGQVSRRQQAQSLDRQLSTQAYYDAESGVNAAINAINNGYLLTSYGKNGKVQCGADSNSASPFYHSSASYVNGSPTNQYSCLLIDPTPGSLSYTNIALDHSTIIPVETVNSSNVPTDPGSINFSWQTNDPSIASPVYTGCPKTFNFGNDTNLPSFNSWSSSCNAGVLQMDIVPYSAFSTSNATCTSLGAAATASVRGCLSAAPTGATKTVFLEPDSSLSSPNATVSYGSLKEGQVIPVACGISNSECVFSINGFANATAAYNFKAYFRVRSFYETNSLTVTTTSGATFANAQATIDSTGESQDVLRRIEVNVPLSENFANEPEFAVQSAITICKDFTIKTLTASPDYTGSIPNTPNTLATLDTYSCNPVP